MTTQHKKPLRQSIEQFHEMAIAQTGLSDFGQTDYLQRLEILLSSCDEQGQLNNALHAFAGGVVTAALSSRLIVENNLRQHPGSAKNAIERPIIIVSMSRSGSTALHRLLAADPNNQALELWLAGSPMPRPPREQWNSHPVFMASRDHFAGFNENPDYKAIHEMAPELADECVHLLFQDFAAVSLSCMINAPDFDRHLFNTDLSPCYERHRKIVQLIGTNEPHKRWVLKDPPSMPNLDQLMRVYPDACFVHIHRDPVKVIPSVCSLIQSGRVSAGAGATEHAEFIPQREMTWWPEALRRGLAARAQRPADFYDLSFTEFVRDPVASIRDIYQHFSLELTEASLNALTHHVETHPRDKHGRHSYTPGDWGITEGEIREQFSFYIEDYGQYL